MPRSVCRSVLLRRRSGPGRRHAAGCGSPATPPAIDPPLQTLVYTVYYNELRTHLSLDEDSPNRRPIQRFSADFTINIAGCSSRQGYPSAIGLSSNLVDQKGRPPMRTLLAMAKLFGVCAACSKQPAATAPPSPATDSKPAASVTANPPAATVTNENVAPSPNKMPMWSPT